MNKTDELLCETMSDRSKNLVLKKCYFPLGFNGSMENIVQGISEKLPNHLDRRFNSGDLFRESVVADIEKCTHGLFVEIQTYDKGATGLVNFSDNAEKANIEEFHAPENKEFLHTHIMLLVVKDHIIACGLGNRDASLKNLFDDLGRKSGGLSEDVTFRIDDVPNKTELEKASAIGVKAIDLNLNSYLASFEEFKYDSNVRNMAQVIQKVLGSPDDESGLRKRASATGRLILKRGKKFKKEEIPKDEWLTDIAETVIDSSFDEYTIELEDGTKISTSKLKVQKPVRLKRFGNTVDSAEMKAAILKYYGELTENGALDW